MIRKSDLIIYTKVESMFIYRIYPVVKGFPKSEKHALSKEIKRYFFSYLSSINSANSVKTKRRYHAECAEAELKNIRLALKVARSQKYISLEFYESIDLELTDISKMLTAYIIQSSK